MTNDIGSTVSYTAAATLTIGGLSLNEWAAITGIVLGILTFAFNIYWKVTHTERRSYPRDDGETNRRGIDQ